MENSVTEKKNNQAQNTPPLNRREKVAYCFCSEEIWFTKDTANVR